MDISALAQALRNVAAGTYSTMTVRELGIALEVASNEKPQTVRGLAALLNIPKPPVTRSLDRLEQLGLVKRVPDTQDRRSVNVVATQAGQNFAEFIVTSVDQTPAESIAA